MRFQGSSRGRIRSAFWIGLLLIPVALFLADAWSRRAPTMASGIRVVTVNVDTQPLAVAQALTVVQPDVVFMQETGGTCTEAGLALGLAVREGSDQCLLSRWPARDQPVVGWPGPWQPPQSVQIEHPTYGPLLLVNVRLAMPRTVAVLAGHTWYTAAQRQAQSPALRQIAAEHTRAVVCGDFNALPLEVDLGARFHSLWMGGSYGATFPGVLPAARIDQCWGTTDLVAGASWTKRVPSDHRAVVITLHAG
jgi:endonuclease/exonuclease/phosphatase family metal-dependent hydrolase